MSKIKSALELALERTASVVVDKDAVRRDQAIKKGKNLAGRYLGDPKSLSLSKELANCDREESGWVKEGLLDSLLANITLPRYETDLKGLPVITAGIKDIGPLKGGEARNLDHLLTQFTGMFKEYLENLDHLEGEIRAQWAPRLRQKEEQLKQQTGQSVTLVPEQDPEFGKFFSEQISRLDAQYGEVLSQGKAEIRKFI